MQLLFLTTVGCHLCDQALAFLQQLPVKGSYLVDVVDIAEVGNEHLFEKYAERIPVLLNEETGKDLCWPFQAMDVQALIGEIASVQ